jgi:hypothetical protein
MRDVGRVGVTQRLRTLCETTECVSVADSFLSSRTATDAVGCCLYTYAYAPPPQKVFIVVALVVLSLLLVAAGTIGALPFVWRVAYPVREYLVMLGVLTLSLIMSLVWWALMIDLPFDSFPSILLWFGIELAQILVCVVVAMLSLKWLFAFVFLVREKAWTSRTERIVSFSVFGCIGALGVAGLGCVISVALQLQ